MSPPTEAIQPLQSQGANLSKEEVLFEGKPALVHSLGALLLAIVTLGLALIWFYFKRGGTTYKITNQRVVIDSGIFSKKMEQLDLYRINDFTIERPFSQRVMGTGNIRLSTFDKTTPTVFLQAMKTDVVQLYETMRVAVESLKQSRNVRMIDYEQGQHDHPG
ncbi:MAG TPA: PH domain-containing protein [Polyangiaceae bacterium]|nr:PH domain-containing protein [Polyangiaceae bacterium]